MSENEITSRKAIFHHFGRSYYDHGYDTVIISELRRLYLYDGANRCIRLLEDHWPWSLDNRRGHGATWVGYREWWKP